MFCHLAHTLTRTKGIAWEMVCTADIHFVYSLRFTVYMAKKLDYFSFYLFDSKKSTNFVGKINYIYNKVYETVLQNDTGHRLWHRNLPADCGILHGHITGRHARQRLCPHQGRKQLGVCD